jgi:NADH:ubiquinone oxidoreductase subunit 5 (subunit L)/multisubunit Na+/H+ antiporter MnhA subunit
MTWPLIALAVMAVFVGWTWELGLPFDEPVLEYMLAYGNPVPSANLWSMHYYALGASLVIMLVGIGMGIAYYAPPNIEVFGWMVPLSRKRFSAAVPAARFPRVYRFLSHKWYFDEFYNLLFVRPTLALARGLGWGDQKGIDAVVNGAAWVTERLSRLQGVFDSIAVDGLVNLTAKGVYLAGDYGRAFQTGRLRNYLMILALGLVGLFAGVFVWARG